MASRLTSQDIIMCDMCQRSPVQMHCKICATNLCTGCVGNHMLDTSKSHNVVIFKLRNLDPIFPDCQKHSKQRCELHCRQCDIPLCTKCIASGDQKRHDITELLKIFNCHKDALKKKAEDLENSVYPTYERNISHLKEKVDKLPESYENVMSAISEQGEEWHQEVDIIINRYKEKVQKMKKDDLENLKKILNEKENLLSALRQTIVDLNDLLSSNNVTKIMNEKALKSDFEDLSSPVDVFPPLFTYLPIKREELAQMFGTLETSSISRPATIKKPNDKSNLSEKLNIGSSNISTSIDTGITGGLLNVASLGTDQVWVSGTHEIKRFTLDGSLQEIVTTTTGTKANGITVSQDGDLIYTDGCDRSINRVRHGKIQKIISLQQGWEPTRVYSTPTDDLLVSMRKSSTPSRVVRFSGTTEKQIIEFDEQGKPLFSSHCYLYITENSEKDMICVSDQGKQNVLLFTQAGKLCFRYTGNLSFKKLFDPRGVVIDSMGHILVADLDKNCIHIIEKNGNFICYIDNCSLNCPFDLSLNRNNMLYVGEKSSATVNLKVIQYLK